VTNNEVQWKIKSQLIIQLAFYWADNLKVNSTLKTDKSYLHVNLLLFRFSEAFVDHVVRRFSNIQLINSRKLQSAPLNQSNKIKRKHKQILTLTSAFKSIKNHTISYQITRKIVAPKTSPIVKTKWQEL
jgi:hypothetical protein